MKKVFLFLLLGSSAFAQLPVVSISNAASYPNTPSGLFLPEHGSVSVEFTYTGTAHFMRTRAVAGVTGACTNESGGILTYEGGDTDLHNTKSAFWQNNDDSRPYFDRAMFGALKADTDYQLYISLSSDAQNWSSGTCVNYHTPALPAIHPVPPEQPIIPAWVQAMPDMSGVSAQQATCSDVVSRIQAAQDNQIRSAALITLDPALQCDNVQFLMHRAVDGISISSSLVNPTNNTLGVPTSAYPGGACGGGASNGQIPCLTEGMSVRFANFFVYSGNNPPLHLHLANSAASAAIGYKFFVHLPNASDPTNVQLFYPKPYSQCSSCLWTLGDAGSGSIQMYEWPRPLKPIVVRTAVPDSAFAPEHTRIDPRWISKMPTFRNSFLVSGGFAQSGGDANNQIAIGNLWWMGIHWKFIPSGQNSPNPTPFVASNYPSQGAIAFGTGHSDGPVVWDRNWIEGPDFGDRITKYGGFSGLGIALKDTYINNFQFWTPISTWQGASPSQPSGITQTTGTTNFQIGPGEWHGGKFNYKQTGTIHVNISGQPSAGTQKEGLIYFDVNNNIHVALPAGVSGTTDVGTIETAIDNGGDNSCQLNSQVVPKLTGGQSDGRASVAPIACVFIGANGLLTGLYPAGTVQVSGRYPGNSDSGEGSDTFIQGDSVGEALVEDCAWVDSNGISTHYDDCLNGGMSCMVDSHDFLWRRNLILRPSKQIRTSPDWDGNLHLNRQSPEWKHGSRIAAIGNIYDGSFACGSQENTGSSWLVKTIGMPVTDVLVRSNIFRNGCGLSSFGAFTGYSAGGAYPLTAAMSRFEFSNNLSHSMNAWVNADYYDKSYHGGIGWLFQQNGISQDVRISHNTFLDQDGLVPHSIDVNSGLNEGFVMDNNILPYTISYGGGGSGLRNGGSGQWDARATPNCTGLADKQMLDCAFISGLNNPSYSFKNNVIYLGWSSTNIVNQNCDDGSHATCLLRYQTPQNGQADYQTVVNAYAGTQSTVVNSTSGVPNAIAALKFIDSAKHDYRLRVDSCLISGRPSSCLASGLGDHASDGKDAGADIDKLQSEIGAVTLIGVPGSSITTSGAMVAFLAPDAQGCPVDVSTTDPNVVSSFTRFVDSGTTAIRNVTMTGLASGTLFYYRVNCQVFQPTGMFRTK